MSNQTQVVDSPPLEVCALATQDSPNGRENVQLGFPGNLMVAKTMTGNHQTSGTRLLTGRQINQETPR